MLRKLRPHLSFANVTSVLALFVALGGTGAYAANTVFSTDIVDNQVYPADVRDDTLSGGGLSSQDIANGAMTTNEIRDDTQGFGGLFSQDLAAGSVRASEVQDGSLNDEDIAEGTYHFGAFIGSVDPNSCTNFTVLGLPTGVGGDHLLLTPDHDTTAPRLIYTIEYTSVSEAALKACNPTTSSIADESTTFKLLWIDAQ